MERAIRALTEKMTGKRVAALAFSAIVATSLFFPTAAFAEVNIGGTVINQGENAVGGGTATLGESVLDMVDVVADGMTITDENLTVNFNGGNKIGHINEGESDVVVDGSSNVTVNFTGENDVEDFAVKGDSTLTVNADGHDDLEELNASDNANLVVNVTGENDFEKIVGTDNANVTLRGTDCQKKDIVNIEDGEKAILKVENGNLTIDHVTVNLKGEKENSVSSATGNIVIDTSKIAAEDSAWSRIDAGGTMLICESVVELAGEVASKGMMTIQHSDVKASKPEKAEEDRPYRVFSYTGIKLIDEKNGEVGKGKYKGHEVWYVDTDGNDGSDVDLKADGDPAYYKCGSSTKGMPKTDDDFNPLAPIAAVIASAATAWFASRRRETT